MQTKEVIVVGVHAAEVAVKYHPEQILTAYVEQDLQSKQIEVLVAALKDANIVLDKARSETLDKLSQGVAHQGICLRVKVPHLSEMDLLEVLRKKETPSLTLILDGIHNPHNLGACLRSAESFGVDAVVVPSHQTVGLTPAVSKSACGAEQLIPLVQVSNLVRFIEHLKQLNIWVAGLSADATQYLHQLDVSRSLALVMGQEGRGLRNLTESSCDYLVKIPMVGRTTNLNLSVAAGIGLYEIARQRL